MHMYCVMIGDAGVDVYASCQRDYVGANVTAANFVKLITGDKSVGIFNTHAHTHAH